MMTVRRGANLRVLRPSWCRLSSSLVAHSNTNKPQLANANVQEGIAVRNDVQDDYPLMIKSLEGRVNHDTLKALTIHPLGLTTMTLVQERVAALLPDLVRPDRNPIPPSHDWKSSPPDRDIPRDILVRAKMGVGKTLAYIIPAIELRLGQVEHHASHTIVKTGSESLPHIVGRARLAYRRNSIGPLILAPTRELAIQVASDVQKLTTHQRDFEVQLLVGGVGKSQQMKDWLESPRDLVVATPGRLRDLLINAPEFRQGLKSSPLLILDEVDTLLSMGFRDDIEAIVSCLPYPPLRQTFLFSATMSRAVRQLASWILSPNHLFFDAAPPEPGLTPRQSGESSASSGFLAPCNHKPLIHNHIEQSYTLCPAAPDQMPTLLKLLAHDQLVHGPNSKVIVFCPTVQVAELCSTLLRCVTEEILPDKTAEIVTMHSNMRQSDRNRTRLLFHNAPNGRPTVLVSSDLGAGGVDYSRITRVIQIGIPNKEDHYIRRIYRWTRGLNSFALEKGKEVEKSMHANLLLLPWEAGYMNWQLTSLPMKSLPIPVLDDRLAPFSSQSSTLTTEFLGPSLAKIQRRVDPADVRRTAASLLGYYLPLSPSMRLQPDSILAGVSAWASECFGVSIPSLTRLPRKFTEAYEQSKPERTRGLFVDGLKIAGASSLGKAKSQNRSVWEGADKRRRKPQRWY